MSTHRMSIRNVATILLMVILFMPAVVHAHTLELPGTEATHLAGGCHGAANDDMSDRHQFDVLCCELDTPYILPYSTHLAVPDLTGKPVSPLNGRQLDGYARKIYKPPR